MKFFQNMIFIFILLSISFYKTNNLYLADIQDQLIGYFGLDNLETSNSVTSNPSQIQGTLDSNNLTADRFGIDDLAIQFGTGNIEIAGELDFGVSDYTISFWVQGDSATTIAYQYLMIKADGIEIFRLQDSNNLKVLNSGNEVLITNVFNGNWQQITVVRNYQTLGVFLNGKKYTEVASFYSYNYNIPNNNFFIGSDSSNSARFTGKLDEIRFYAKGMSEKEVYSLYLQTFKLQKQYECGVNKYLNASNSQCDLNCSSSCQFCINDSDLCPITEINFNVQDFNDKFNQFNGISASTTFTVDKSGNNDAALEFNDDIIEFTTENMLDQVLEASICYWVYSNDSVNQQIIIYGQQKTNLSEFVIKSNGEVIVHKATFQFDIKLIENEWNHVCYIRDDQGINMYGYQNGFLMNLINIGEGFNVNQNSSTNTIKSLDIDYLSIGKSNQGTGDQFVGKLDSIQFFTKSLSQEEVQNLYSNGIFTVLYDQNKFSFELSSEKFQNFSLNEIQDLSIVDYQLYRFNINSSNNLEKVVSSKSQAEIQQELIFDDVNFTIQGDYNIDNVGDTYEIKIQGKLKSDNSQIIYETYYIHLKDYRSAIEVITLQEQNFILSRPQVLILQPSLYQVIVWVKDTDANSSSSNQHLVCQIFDKEGKQISEIIEIMVNKVQYVDKIILQQYDVTNNTFIVGYDYSPSKRVMYVKIYNQYGFELQSSGIFSESVESVKNPQILVNQQNLNIIILHQKNNKLYQQVFTDITQNSVSEVQLLANSQEYKIFKQSGNINVYYIFASTEVGGGMYDLFIYEYDLDTNIITTTTPLKINTNSQNTLFYPYVIEDQSNNEVFILFVENDQKIIVTRFDLNLFTITFQQIGISISTGVLSNPQIYKNFGDRLLLIWEKDNQIQAQMVQQSDLSAFETQFTINDDQSYENTQLQSYQIEQKIIIVWVEKNGSVYKIQKKIFSQQALVKNQIEDIEIRIGSTYDLVLSESLFQNLSYFDVYYKTFKEIEYTKSTELTPLFKKTNTGVQILEIDSILKNFGCGPTVLMCSEQFNIKIFIKNTNNIYDIGQYTSFKFYANYIADYLLHPGSTQFLKIDNKFGYTTPDVTLSSSLPDWISYMPAERMFILYANGDLIGDIVPVTFQMQEQGDPTSFEQNVSFDIKVVNDDPQIEKQIGKIVFNLEGENQKPLNIELINYFQDNDINDTLFYTLQTLDSDPTDTSVIPNASDIVPDFIQIQGDIMKIESVANDQIGLYFFRIIAEDDFGVSSVQQDFILEIAIPQPVISQSNTVEIQFKDFLNKQQIRPYKQFEFFLDKETFIDSRPLSYKVYILEDLQSLRRNLNSNQLGQELLDTGDFWLKFNENQLKIYGTPEKNNIKSYQINVSANNGLKENVQSFTFTINNQSPSFKIKPQNQIQSFPEIGEEFEFAFSPYTCVDPDDDPIEIIVENLEDFKFDSQNYLLSGTPSTLRLKKEEQIVPIFETPIEMNIICQDPSGAQVSMLLLMEVHPSKTYIFYAVVLVLLLIVLFVLIVFSKKIIYKMLCKKRYNYQHYISLEQEQLFQLQIPLIKNKLQESVKVFKELEKQKEKNSNRQDWFLDLYMKIQPNKGWKINNQKLMNDIYQITQKKFPNTEIHQILQLEIQQVEQFDRQNTYSVIFDGLAAQKQFDLFENKLTRQYYQKVKAYFIKEYGYSLDWYQPLIKHVIYQDSKHFICNKFPEIYLDIQKIHEIINLPYYEPPQQELDTQQNPQISMETKMQPQIFDTIENLNQNLDNVNDKKNLKQQKSVEILDINKTNNGNLSPTKQHGNIMTTMDNSMQKQNKQNNNNNNNIFPDYDNISEIKQNEMIKYQQDYIYPELELLVRYLKSEIFGFGFKNLGQINRGKSINIEETKISNIVVKQVKIKNNNSCLGQKVVFEKLQLSQKPDWLSYDIKQDILMLKGIPSFQDKPMKYVVQILDKKSYIIRQLFLELKPMQQSIISQNYSKNCMPININMDNRVRNSSNFERLLKPDSQETNDKHDGNINKNSSQKQLNPSNVQINNNNSNSNIQSNNSNNKNNNGTYKRRRNNQNQVIQEDDRERSDNNLDIIEDKSNVGLFATADKNDNIYDYDGPVSAIKEKDLKNIENMDNQIQQSKLYNQQQIQKQQNNTNTMQKQQINSDNNVVDNIPVSNNMRNSIINKNISNRSNGNNIDYNNQGELEDKWRNFSYKEKNIQSINVGQNGIDDQDEKKIYNYSGSPVRSSTKGRQSPYRQSTKLIGVDEIQSPSISQQNQIIVQKRRNKNGLWNN